MSAQHAIWRTAQPGLEISDVQQGHAKIGEGCLIIAEEPIDSCSTVLGCADGFTKKDGVVTCT